MLLELPRAVDALHDGVPLRIIREGAFGAEEAVAWLWRGQADQRDLDWLALEDAGIFVENDRLAADSAVEGAGHGRLLDRGVAELRGRAGVRESGGRSAGVLDEDRR